MSSSFLFHLKLCLRLTSWHHQAPHIAHGFQKPRVLKTLSWCEDLYLNYKTPLPRGMWDYYFFNIFPPLYMVPCEFLFVMCSFHSKNEWLYFFWLGFFKLGVGSFYASCELSLFAAGSTCYGFPCFFHVVDLFVVMCGVPFKMWLALFEQLGFLLCVLSSTMACLSFLAWMLC